ncbi:MAG: hypothetical protein NC395_01225 [Prevotella sp.]|nr:hypothetical protein [Prevotella sp.]
MKNVNVTAIFAFLSAMLVIVGVGLLIGAAVTNSHIENSRPVAARVVDNVKVRSKGHSTRHKKMLYAPVYEYTDGGETKTYQSSVSTSNAQEIGAEATLYISDDGKVYEGSGTFIMLLVGIILAVVGGVFAFVTVWLSRKISAETGGNEL